ncbi:multidrug MFS transporter [Mycobacterium sp. djl-10]|nr:multidrug MFS transporter [Mycobacterium sp. djl-10]
MQRYTPTISADTVADLRARLQATRLPDAPEAAGWSLGIEVDSVADLIRYWADGFDFAAHNAELASLPSVRVTVDGIAVHVIHAEAEPGPDVLPVLLAHGWPDSGWRYRKVISRLTDPSAYGIPAGDRFHVVVPDMPGFGFSDRPPGPAPDSRAVAGMWAQLMTSLGYPKFVVSGGDIGSQVARHLALDHPDRVIAVHRTDAGLPVVDDPTDLSDDEQRWIADGQQWALAEGAYAAMHRTKPQTAAVGLTDSPAGLAAWVLEKLRSWSDCGGDLWSVYTRDEVLALLTEYWATETIGSSMRMYNANAAIPPSERNRFVTTPSGFSLFPVDIATPPRRWLERTTNLVYVNTPQRGGHFAPFEQPDIFADELREFFRPFRGRNA